MERNTKTTIYHLQIGDRFYKCNDKSKTIYEKVQQEAKQTYYQTYRHFGICAAFADDTRISEQAKKAAFKSFKSDTEVIFLRHKIEA